MRDELPFVVVLQSDLLGMLATRLVAPLARGTSAHGKLPARLSPSFEIGGEKVLLVPQETAALDARLLRRPVASLREQAHRLVDALDAVISGV